MGRRGGRARRPPGSGALPRRPVERKGTTRLPGPAGAAFTIYYGEVSEDSDGPVEWCRPVPAAVAEAVAARYPELTLRAEPAHEEAFAHLGDTQATPHRWQLIAETMHARAAAQGLREANLAEGLAPRVTLLGAPAADGTPAPLPDCDYAVPFRRS